METDNTIYKIFKTDPDLAFQLLGQPNSVPYDFKAIQVKDIKRTFDGVLEPLHPDPSLPIVFFEAQVEPDPTLYRRMALEVSAYLMANNPPNPIFSLVIYPDRSVERLVANNERVSYYLNLHRVFIIDDLQPGVSQSQDMLRLLFVRDEIMIQEAQKIISAPHGTLPRTTCVEIVTDILSRRFPHLSNQEIIDMLQLAPLEQTKPFQEGLQEGRKEGVDQERLRIAREMLDLGKLSAQEIATLTQLNPSQIQKLRESLD